MKTRKHEVGGEFQLTRRGKISRFRLHKSDARNAHNRVIIEDNYEIEFHTHPNKELIELPSPHDLRIMMLKKIENTHSCRGQLGVIINSTGVVSYKFLGSKKLPMHAFASIQRIYDAGSNAAASNHRQIKAIMNRYPFCLKFRTWSQIRKSRGFVIGLIKI